METTNEEYRLSLLKEKDAGLSLTSGVIFISRYIPKTKKELEEQLNRVFAFCTVVVAESECAYECVISGNMCYLEKTVFAFLNEIVLYTMSGCINYYRHETAWTHFYSDRHRWVERNGTVSFDVNRDHEIAKIWLSKMTDKERLDLAMIGVDMIMNPQYLTLLPESGEEWDDESE